jgi:microcystin-dependent protein
MANIEVKLRRGTDTEHSSFTGAEGEVTVDTTNNTLRVHDNSTAGGIRLAKLSEVGGLSDDSVTFAKMQNINTAKVIGRTTAGSGDPEEVSILDDDTMATASATSLATSESIKAYVDSEIGIPTGTVSAFAGATAPTGYALCDGSEYSETTEAALFAVLGSTYNTGGETANHFRVPDLRGRVVAGMGGSLLSGTDALADTGGASTHTLTEAEMPSHSHDYFRASADRIGSGAGSARVEDRSNNTEQTTDTGGDQAHNNVQPTIILNYIIKT